MIEIRKTTSQHPFMLFIKGKESASSFVQRKEHGRRGKKHFTYLVQMMNRRDFFSVLEAPCFYLNKHFIEVIEYKGIETLGGYDYHLNVIVNPAKLFLIVLLESKPLKWQQDFEYRDVQQELIQTFNEDSDTKAHQLGNTLRIQVDLDKSELISNRLAEVINTLRKRLFIIIKDLEGYHSLSFTFNFPKQYSSALKKYLIHFAEFLTDIGIGATADIRQKEGEILFTVVPEDRTESLDKIRQALEIYLEIAKYPIAKFEEDEDITLLKLKNEIEHLHEQLSLSKKAFEIKNSQALLLEQAFEHSQTQQRLLLAKNVSPQTDLNKKDREEIINGILAVKPLEKDGVEIHLPNIVRWIKSKIFRKTIETDTKVITIDKLNE